MKNATTNNHARRGVRHKKKLRPGQPEIRCKLDDALERKLCKFIREGLSYETCCDLAGIGRQTFYDWEKRARENPESRYGQFERAVRQANAEAIRTLHGEARKSNPLWVLERRFPELYGPPKLRTELSGPSSGTLPISMNPFLVQVTIDGTLPEHPPVEELHQSDPSRI
jgi:hypothetical protein